MRGARIRGLAYLIDLSSSNEAGICFSHARVYVRHISDCAFSSMHLPYMHRMCDCAYTQLTVYYVHLAKIN